MSMNARTSGCMSEANLEQLSEQIIMLAVECFVPDFNEKISADIVLA